MLSSPKQRVFFWRRFLPAPATSVRHGSFRKEREKLSAHTCPHARVCHLGPSLVVAWTEGMILDHVVITTARLIWCCIKPSLLLMKCMKSPRKVVVWMEPIEIFRPAGSEIMVYWLKKISPVHPFIFTLNITFMGKYKAIQMFLNSDFLKISWLLIPVLSNTFSLGSLTFICNIGSACINSGHFLLFMCVIVASSSDPGKTLQNLRC